MNAHPLFRRLAEDFPDQFGTPLRPAPLAHLSLQHCPPGAVPSAPTNEDRARALRDVQPVPVANAHPWPHLAA